MTSVAGELEHMDIQQTYSEGVNNRWDADDWDNENSSARLFERSRIKALAGKRAVLAGRDVGGGGGGGGGASSKLSASGTCGKRLVCLQQ